MTLRAQKDENWGEKVEIVSGDMREWKDNGNVKADIIVSELLGSFGDNELSPECLYDAQHLFKVRITFHSALCSRNFQNVKLRLDIIEI